MKQGKRKTVAIICVYPTDWDKFTKKYPRRASKKIREWVKKDLQHSKIPETTKIKLIYVDPDDWEEFLKRHPQSASRMIRNWVKEDLEED